MKMHIISLQQDTPTWHAWRSKHICATDSSVIMGVNPFKTLEQLREEKLLGWEVPLTPKQKARTDEGKLLEIEARTLFCELFGRQVLPVCCVCDERNWMGASLDGLSDDKKFAVEIKCGLKAYYLASQDRIAEYYYSQLQHQLAVTGLDMIYYMAYRSGEEFTLLEVPRCDLYIADMINHEYTFWRSLYENDTTITDSGRI